jgi:hypothetical protein
VPKRLLTIIAVLIAAASSANAEDETKALANALDRDCNAKYSTTASMNGLECLQAIARALKRVMDDADLARYYASEAREAAEKAARR